MFEVGRVIAGKYRIDRELGQGGMGKVVAATHLQLTSGVALKYLTPEMQGDDRIVARFLREARSAAQLRSEHICRVLDVGEEDGNPYIVMELLEGSDLNKLAKHGAIDMTSAVEYVRQACVGLAEAHARGIVHRDLKPHNLFLTSRPDGSALVKVFDFGVAKAPDVPGSTGPRLTATIHMVGSPAFMSPEQIESSRDVDARSDVWSLGVILYRLISGELPFDGSNVAQLAMRIVEDVKAPALSNAPAELSAIVARCLEKDPADRFQTVTELADALRPFGGVARPLESSASIASSPAVTAATAAVMPPSISSLVATTERSSTNPRVQASRRRLMFVAIGLFVGGLAGWQLYDRSSGSSEDAATPSPATLTTATPTSAQPAAETAVPVAGKPTAPAGPTHVEPTPDEPAIADQTAPEPVTATSDKPAIITATSDKPGTPPRERAKAPTTKPIMKAATKPPTKVPTTPAPVKPATGGTELEKPDTDYGASRI